MKSLAIALAVASVIGLASQASAAVVRVSRVHVGARRAAYRVTHPVAPHPVVYAPRPVVSAPRPVITPRPIVVPSQPTVVTPAPVPPSPPVGSPAWRQLRAQAIERAIHDAVEEAVEDALEDVQQ